MSELEVTWLNGVRRLRPTSMEKYSRELMRALLELCPEELRIRVNEIHGIHLPALRGLINRYISYTLKNICLSPGVYHALDHANAHLMRLLPPGSVGILTVHDVEQLRTPFWACRDLPAKLFGRPGIKAADRIVTVSEATRDEMADLTGYPRELVKVIPNGVDHDLYRPDGPAAHASFSYILHVGSEKPRKNVTALMRVLAELRESGILLFKAGKPGGEEYRRRTLKEARQLGVEGNIDFRGYVGERELAELYRGALALVMPSLYEGFGIPVIEAMACGCPVICSDIPAFREVAGNAALLYHPDDVRGMAEAVLRLRDDEAFRRSVIAAGTARAERFSWKRCAEEHLKLYREVSTGSPTGRRR